MFAFAYRSPICADRTSCLLESCWTRAAAEELGGMCGHRVLNCSLRYHNSKEKGPSDKSPEQGTRASRDPKLFDIMGVAAIKVAVVEVSQVLLHRDLRGVKVIGSDGWAHNGHREPEPFP